MNIDYEDDERIDEAFLFEDYIEDEGLHFKDYMNLPLDGQRELVQKTLARLSELRELPCGTKTGEKLWKEKIDYQIWFYWKLMDQIESSHWF